MFQSDKKSNALGSILDPDIEINGDIDVSANLVVHGKINGNITSTQTINTAKGSKIKGNIIAKNVMISGEICGDIEVSDKIVLCQNAHLIGNLKASILVIEEGAKFDGMSNMLKAKNMDSKVKKINTIKS
jgi:cytoskeletal protein CcmA (bactofilin family)